VKSRFRTLAFAAALGGALLALPAPAFALSSAPDTTGMTNGKVYAMARSGNTLFIGGTFTKVLGADGRGGFAAANLAAIDMTTGLGISSFHPAVTRSDGAVQVRSLALDGDTLYVGGSFDAIGGQPHLNLGAVSISTRAPIAAFDPSVGVSGSTVDALLVGGGRIHLGGEFLAVNGVAKTRMAAVDANGDVVTGWKANANARVRVLVFALDGQTIFAGGRFSKVNGIARQSVARLSTATGAPTTWAIPAGTIPNPMTAFDFVVTPTRLYGGFGAKPNFAAAFRLDNGDVATQVWRWNTVGNVESVALQGTRLFASGHFGTGQLQQTVCGTFQLHGLVALSAATGTVDCTWQPALAPFGNNYIGGWALLLTTTQLWVCGSFTTVTGDQQKSIARFTL
jgi:hypothetical protein